jgi:hypothetical protein
MKWQDHPEEEDDEGEKQEEEEGGRKNFEEVTWTCMCFVVHACDKLLNARCKSNHTSLH